MGTSFPIALERCGVLPVVVLDHGEDAVPLARALLAGGVDCAEVTLRTSAGIAAITAMSAVPDFFVGAGTVLTANEVRACVAAGARFIVSPGFDAGVVEACLSLDVPVLPGVATPTEIMVALAAGLTTLKLFPAKELGGIAMIRSLRGPFPGVRFVPSGGVNIDTAPDYVDDGVAAMGTTWIAPRALVSEGRFAEIEERARRFREAIGR